MTSPVRKSCREGGSLRRAGTREKQLRFHIYTRASPERGGGQFPKDSRSLLCLCVQAHKDSNSGLELSEVFTYLSCMCNRRKILSHIFVNDLINEKRMRLSAANPNCWLMLKMASTTCFSHIKHHAYSFLTFPR